LWVHFPFARILLFFTIFRDFVIFQFFHSKFTDVFSILSHFWRFSRFCAILVAFFVFMVFRVLLPCFQDFLGCMRFSRPCEPRSFSYHFLASWSYFPWFSSFIESFSSLIGSELWPNVVVIFLREDFCHFSQNFVILLFFTFFIVNFLMFFAKYAIFDVFSIFARFWSLFGFLVVFRSFSYDFHVPGFLEDFHDPVSLGIKREGKQGKEGRILHLREVFLGIFSSIIIHKFYFLGIFRVFFLE
jgi:hypothetical protein